jgi:hypothetical protein
MFDSALIRQSNNWSDKYMKTLVDILANQETDLEGLELVELGGVSEETRGSFWGGSWDGGWGVRTP